MSQDLQDLIHRYIRGTATADETAALQEALKADAELRATYLDLMNLDIALESVADVAEMMPIQPRVAPPSRMRRSAWMQWRPLTAAAAGVMFGMFCTSMVWAYVVPRTGKRVVLLREGFESGVKRTDAGLPKVAGVWSGDEAEVVPATGELKAKTGTHMLRFSSATYAGENAPKSNWGNVYRLVDLGGPAGETVDSLRLVANFTSTSFPAGEEYICFIELCAVDENAMPAVLPDDLPWYRENSSAVATRKLPLKGDGNWHPINVVMPLPPQARFALVHVAVMRAKPSATAEPVHFDGHYVDDVKLELISPSGMR